MTNRTFTMIKPDAFANGHSGAILNIIIKAGFRLVALKMTSLTDKKAGEFYAVHQARPFYGELVEFMSRGPVIAAILEKQNAVADFRKLIGATDPAKRMREPSASFLLHPSARMPFMEATVMKMPAWKGTFSSRAWKESNPGSFSFLTYIFQHILPIGNGLMFYLKSCVRELIHNDLHD